MMGLYASLVAGGLMLAYAIWYVTVVNVDNDYSFLTLVSSPEPPQYL